MSDQPGPYELSVMLFDATGKAVRPVFSRKVNAENAELLFDALTELVEHDLAPRESECTCYEIIGGHQQGCAFYGVKAETVTITLRGQNCPHCGEAIHG